MAAAQTLRRNQNPANTAGLNSNGAKNSQDVREGERRLPSEHPPPPSTPLIVSSLSKAALREGFNVDGK